MFGEKLPRRNPTQEAEPSSRIANVPELDGQVEQFVRLEQFPGKAMVEGLPLQQLHSDEGLAFMLAALVNRTDVGVVQRRGGAGFTLEAF